MVKVNEDGIRVYGGDLIYFNDWLKMHCGSDSESIRASLLCDSKDSEEVEEHMDELEEEFQEYCERNNYIGETV